MKHKLIALSAVSGAISIILGAIAAHQLKNLLSESSLDAFDKGVKYQMFQSLFLVILGISCNSENHKVIKNVALLAFTGMCLFSLSIYLLSTQVITNINFSWLGPITPLGGLAMIVSWLLFAVKAKQIFK
ncbi:MAG: DUF423 domain-containing protein [Bacteroidota bacterium]|jgi:uncharacterized membrane protein YgdD (TMEM256/DUF423 family)